MTIEEKIEKILSIPVVVKRRTLKTGLIKIEDLKLRFKNEPEQLEGSINYHLHYFNKSVLCCSGNYIAYGTDEDMNNIVNNILTSYNNQCVIMTEDLCNIITRSIQKNENDIKSNNRFLVRHVLYTINTLNCIIANTTRDVKLLKTNLESINFVHDFLYDGYKRVFRLDYI